MNEEIENKIEDLVKTMGFELWDINIGKGFFNIYVDKVFGYITIDECASINENIKFMLKNENLCQENVSITVSSPGINRKLKTRYHFEKSIGKKVKIITKEKIDNKNYFIATIKSIRDNELEIFFNETGSSLIIPFAFIKECNINEA